MKLFSSLINTCFLTGRVPFAPGTMGSIFSLILWLFFTPSFTLMLAIILLLVPLSYFTISFELKKTDIKDPQHIVIDEAIGMWISLLFIPSFEYVNAILAFAIFRVLDIFKPSIIRRSEKFEGAHGVLIDDILSGIITCIVILGIISI